MREAGAPQSDFTAAMIEVENTVTERGPGAHPLTGPIYVEGAEPGDVLEVRILDTELLMPSGVSAFRQGGGALPDAFSHSGLRLFELDAEAGVARMGSTATTPLRPFVGSIGSPRRWNGVASRARIPVSTAATSTTRTSSQAPRSSFRSTPEARRSRSGTVTPRRATVK